MPSGLWCYRLDRHRAVLGGSLTDGGSIFEWLCDTLAVTPGNDLDSLIREAEDMPPASHGLVVSLVVNSNIETLSWLVRLHSPYIGWLLVGGQNSAVHT